MVYEVEENLTRVHLFRLVWREGFWNFATEEYEFINESLVEYLGRPREGARSLA